MPKRLLIRPSRTSESLDPKFCRVFLLQGIVHSADRGGGTGPSSRIPRSHPSGSQPSESQLSATGRVPPVRFASLLNGQREQQSNLCCLFVATQLSLFFVSWQLRKHMQCVDHPTHPTCMCDAGYYRCWQNNTIKFNDIPQAR